MSDAFAIGQRVRVRRAWPPGHVRTPHYVRGRQGVIDAVAGHFGNPEELAYGRDGLPRETLYRVRFRLGELWPADSGQGSDSAVVDLFEHWLEPAKEAGS